jgi:diaminopimelate decarboxylase
MASSYNRLPRPAVVAVRDGVARAILRRETPDDQFRLEVEHVSDLASAPSTQRPTKSTERSEGVR